MLPTDACLFYTVANIDKKEFIAYHHLNGISTFNTIMRSSNGFLALLAILLADTNRPHDLIDFDLPPNQTLDIIGHWAGDRIVIVGDRSTSVHGRVYEQCYSRDELEVLATLADNDLGPHAPFTDITVSVLRVAFFMQSFRSTIMRMGMTPTEKQAKLELWNKVCPDGILPFELLTLPE